MSGKVSAYLRAYLLGAMAFGAVAAGTAPSAQAALTCAAGVCTETLTLGPTPTEIVGGTLLFPLFDSNLGTLTSAQVTVRAESRIKAGSTLTNNATSAQTFRVRQDVQFTIIDTTAPGGALDIALQSLTLIPSTGLVLISNLPGVGSAPLNTIPFGPFTNTANGNLVAAVGSLSPFQTAGGGTHAFSTDTLTITTFVGGGGNIRANFITDGFVEFDILYAYVDVPHDAPEPMSLALMGVGLAGLGVANLARRRRKIAAD